MAERKPLNVPAAIGRPVRTAEVLLPDLHPVVGAAFDVAARCGMTAPFAECTGCGGAIRSLADAIEHTSCHLSGNVAEGPLCGQERPLLRLAGVDLPQVPCVRPAGHDEGPHRGADGSEWTVTVPDWWEQAQQQLGDILAALIRRTGADRVELADDELAKRGPDEMVSYRYDEDGCALVEITTEGPDGA